jgi:hypothetical protein
VIDSRKLTRRQNVLFANFLDQLMGSCCMGFGMVMVVIVGLIVLASKMGGGKGGGSTGGSVAGQVGRAVAGKVISHVIDRVFKK